VKTVLETNQRIAYVEFDDNCDSEVLFALQLKNLPREMVQSCIICREEGSKGFFGLKGKSRATISAWVKSARLDDDFLNNPNYFLNNPLVKICFRHFHQDCFKFGKERLLLKPGMYFFVIVYITNRLSTEVKKCLVISMEISVFSRFFDQKSQMQRVEF
jgi:hypothetical protein